jgi:hypothetical protein
MIIQLIEPWILFEYLDMEIPSLIPGLIASAIGMYFGSKINDAKRKFLSRTFS